MNSHDYSTTEPDFNDPLTIASGVILTTVVRGGLPEDLVVPIEAPTIGNAGTGKRPAMLGSLGEWNGLHDWPTREFSTALLLQASQDHGNCGLRLGRISEREPRLNVFAIDIDLCEGYEGAKDALLAALARHCGGQPMPWRSTHSYRALVLVNVLNMDSGRQHNWEAKRYGYSAGKIQLLTYGSQCVVSGLHYSGNRIAWRVAGDERVWPWPPIKQVGLPAFESFDALLDMMNTVWQELKAEGFEFPIQSVSTEGMSGDVDAANLAPPDLSISDVVNAFERMRNPASVNRDIYIEIGLAAGGTVRGIEHHHGKLSQSEEDRITAAWAKWASRWEGQPVGTYEAEKAKWLSDFRLNGRVSGWRQLVGLADTYGAGIAIEQAQREFTAEPAPEGYTFSEPYPDGLPDFDRMAERPALIIEYADEFSVEAGLPLVDGWIDQGELLAIIGAPGSYKTTLMADLAGCIAWERPWMGCKTAGGAILVVELEGARGFRNRVIAWHKHHGLDFRKAPIGMVSQGITLTEGANGEDTKRVIGAAKSVAEKTGLPLRLIMIDTMSRVIAPGKSEDSASDISGLVQAVGEIQRQTGAAVALIHHVGLTDGTRGRGSSNQRASWDVELLVQADGRFGTVSAPKQREKEQLPPIPFAAVVVEIGTRQDGKSISACVTRLAEQGEIPEAKAKAPKGQKLGKNESLLLLALKEQRERWQTLPKGPAFPPSGFGMVKDELRDAFYQKLSSDMTRSGKRMAFNRALDTLVMAGLIGMDSDWLWLIAQPGAEFDIEERQ